MKQRSAKIWKSVALTLLTVLLCIVMCFSFAACGSEAPYIGENGNWYVDGNDTGVSAKGDKGDAGAKGDKGEAGEKGEVGEKGDSGSNGDKGDKGNTGFDGEPIGTYDDQYSPSDEIAESAFSAQGHGTNNFDKQGKFYVDYESLDEAKAAAKELAVQVASEGDVLLKNENDALPLKRDENKITLLGIRSVNMVRSGFGSGSGGGSKIDNTLAEAFEDEGFSVNPAPLTMYMKERNQMVEDKVTEVSVDKLSNSILSTFGAYGDAAVLTFSRTGAENFDCATYNALGHEKEDAHYLQLTPNEKALVKLAKEKFPKVIVLINSSNIMEIPELVAPKTTDFGVDAVLWVGGPGMYGATAIARILNGRVNPSGHTVDLWEKDFTKSPVWTNFGSNAQNKDADGNRLDPFYYDEAGGITKFASVEYREDIYSGYRYYETAYEDAAADKKEEAYSNVLFPFGYGLSYTDFEWKLDNVKATDTITAANQTVTMRVWVKNTGMKAGKDVVQVYVKTPYTKGGIEKSARVLMGFGKTKLLQPGQSDVVIVSFVAQEMASFDYNDANGNNFEGYELEAGDYEIYASHNSHDAEFSVTRTVDKATTEALGDKYTAGTADKGFTGIICETDLVTGNAIEPVFTGEYASTNASLMNNKISRATGMRQPAAATKADRTLDDTTLADYESQATYYSYQDKDTDPWYVKGDGIPADWTQESKDPTAKLKVFLKDMAGVPYIEPVIEGGVVTYPDMTDEQKANNKKWEDFMNQFTWEELCTLPATPDTTIERLGAISYSMDGDGNLKPKYTYGDPDGPINAGGIQFPSNPILTATFNKQLALEEGTMVGNLLVLNGSRGWRGGGANIHRSPFSGRNFEYMSEDGVMAGLMAAEVAKGVTSKGIIAHYKHFFGNDQEAYRADYGGVFTWATEQTLREITVKPFEYIIKYGGTLGLMNSFNRIGKYTLTCNYAVHENLLNQEWDFQGSTESDAWAKQFVPANLMVRGGDDSLLTKDSSFPLNALERGNWDAAARGGKGCVKVAKNAEEYTTYDSKVGSMLSPTHYFAVRKSAQRLLQTLANSACNRNCLASEEIDVTLKKDLYNEIGIELDGTTSVFTFAEGVKWPEGMTYNAATGILSGVPTTDIAEDVSGTATCDTWISYVVVTLKFNIVSDFEIGGKAYVPGAKVEMAKTGTVTITMDQLTYGNQLYISKKQNRRIMNCYVSKEDGKWYHRDEDKSAADIVTLGNTGTTVEALADMEKSVIYHLEATGLPAGMTLKAVQSDEMGWAQRSTYKVDTSWQLVGSSTLAAGEYKVTLSLLVPNVSKGTNPWMRAGGDHNVYVQEITIKVS